MSNWSELMFDVEFEAKVSKLCIIELFAVVSDDHPWKIKLAYCQPLDEVFDLLLNDLCWRLSFYPFHKVVYYYDQKNFLTWCHQKWTEDVHSPHRKRTRWWDWGELRCQLLLDVGISLTLVTLFDKILCILLHQMPVVSLVKSFVHQWLATDVVATDAFVDFLKYIIDLRWP